MWRIISRDLDRNVSKWPLIKRQKNQEKIWFGTMYRSFAHLGFFNLRGIYRDKRRRKFCRQLPFKVPMTRTFFCIFRLIAAFKIRNNQPLRLTSPLWPLFCPLKERFCSSGIQLLYGILPAARKRSRGEWTERNLLTLLSQAKQVFNWKSILAYWIQNHSVVRTSALVIVLFTLMSSRNAVELQAVW